MLQFIVQAMLHLMLNKVVRSSTNATTATTTTIGKNIISGKSRYDSYVRQVDRVQPVKSDLDIYLEEGVFRRNEGEDGHFDVLEWWKVNELKFHILSKMACDILAILSLLWRRRQPLVLVAGLSIHIEHLWGLRQYKL